MYVHISVLFKVLKKRFCVMFAFIFAAFKFFKELLLVDKHYVEAFHLFIYAWRNVISFRNSYDSYPTTRKVQK